MPVMLLSKQEIRCLQKEIKILRDQNKRKDEIIKHERGLWNTRSYAQTANI